MRSILIAGLAVALGAGCRRFADPYLGNEAPLLIFTLSVLVAAAYGGLWPGLIATVISAAIGVYFFMVPRFTFTLEGTPDFMRLLMFALVGAGITVLAERLRTSQLRAALSERRYRNIVHTAAEGIWVIDEQGRVLFANPRLAAMLGYSVDELLGCRGTDLIAEEERSEAAEVLADGTDERRAPREWRLRHRDGHEIWTLVSVTPINAGSNSTLAMFTDITEQREAHAASRQQARLLNLSAEPILAWDLGRRITFWNRGAEELYGWSTDEAKGQVVTDLLQTEHPVPRADIERQLQESGSWFGELSHITKDGRRVVVESRWELVRNSRVPPVVLETNRDISERKRAAAELERLVQRLRSLRNIDLAILGTTDMQLVLKAVAEEASSQLGSDVVMLYVFDPHTLTLEPATGIGYRHPQSGRASVRLGEGVAGRAALERRTITINESAAAHTAERFREQMAAEGVESMYSTPLVAKGKLIGALSVFFRRPFQPDEDWLGFFELLAGQAAMAVDSTQAFEQLQRSNLEMRLAYDATIEGWARALELRDRETEGHTRRVTERTVALARLAGLPDEAIVHVRRGALLHDIGKMGIPDAILLKPAELTEDEWQIMRRHPEYARNLLISIHYLVPALDIPYCHHEKWDGTGYPRGLKGDEIPLPARLFAVVDVWDALTSDRPYRQRWPEARALEHIRGLAGTHLDPRAVDLFLGMIRPRSELSQ